MTNPNFPELKIDCAHCLFCCSAIREKKIRAEKNKWTLVHLDTFECRVSRPGASAYFPEINPDDWCGYFCDAETLARPFVGLNADTKDPARLYHTPVHPRKIHAEEQPREEVSE